MALKKLNVAKPPLNWRSALRLFVSSSGGNRLKNTIHRPSRRYGISPGIKIGRNKKLLVAIDTSGSVNQKRLNLFFREVHHLWKLGHEISVLECDAAIQRKYFYRGRLPEMVWGRGGTLYEAPIQLANEQIQPDGLLYFTDGYGPVPKLKSRMPLLWIIASQRMEEGPWDSLPGRKIFID